MNIHISIIFHTLIRHTIGYHSPCIEIVVCAIIHPEPCKSQLFLVLFARASGCAAQASKSLSASFFLVIITRRGDHAKLNGFLCEIIWETTESLSDSARLLLVGLSD